MAKKQRSIPKQEFVPSNFLLAVALLTFVLTLLMAFIVIKELNVIRKDYESRKADQNPLSLVSSLDSVLISGIIAESKIPNSADELLSYVVSNPSSENLSLALRISNLTAKIVNYLHQNAVSCNIDITRQAIEHLLPLQTALLMNNPSKSLNPVSVLPAITKNCIKYPHILAEAVKMLNVSKNNLNQKEFQFYLTKILEDHIVYSITSLNSDLVAFVIDYSLNSELLEEETKEMACNCIERGASEANEILNCKALAQIGCIVSNPVVKTLCGPAERLDDVL